MIVRLIFVSIAVFVFNIPFGYWRINVKKFSWQWILAVHIPVPFIIALRIFVSIGFAWHTYIFMVGAFFLGQRYGAYLHTVRINKNKHVTSCLIMDIFRNKR